MDGQAAMKITVKLFAVLRDAVGSAEVLMDLPAGTTAAQAADTLAKIYPAVSKHLPRAAFAVNRAYVPGSTALQAGDELALIPPVSGG
jgi:molybdopterin converting factor subunit 1